MRSGQRWTDLEAEGGDVKYEILDGFHDAELQIINIERFPTEIHMRFFLSGGERRGVRFF